MRSFRLVILMVFLLTAIMAVYAQTTAAELNPDLIDIYTF